MGYCLSCGAQVDDCDSAYYARGFKCIPCYNIMAEQTAMVSCSRCGTRIRKDEIKRYRGGVYCGYCAREREREERLPVCPVCMKKIESWQEKIETMQGRTVHGQCFAKIPLDAELPEICPECHGEIVPEGANDSKRMRFRCKCGKKKGKSKHDKTILDGLMKTVMDMLY